MCHRRFGYLPYHRIESEARHRRNRYAFRTSSSVEYLRGNDPRQWATCRAEREIIYPSNDDKAPRCSIVMRSPWREHCQKDSRNDERNHVAKIAKYQRPASSGVIDEEDTEELSY